MKPKAYKPRGSLIALFVSLLLAAACGVGYLALSMDKATYEKQTKQINKILFLSTALQIPYLDFLAKNDNGKPDYIAGTGDGTAMSDMTGGVLLLANEEGSLLDNSYNYTNTYHSDKVNILWKDGVACFLYNEEVLMAEKYRVNVYDYEHLDGGAGAQGSFGYPFNAADKMDEVLSNIKIGATGDMYLFIDTSKPDSKRYMVRIDKNNSSSSQQMQYGQEPLRYDDAWRREAKNLLGIGALLFLALYWLGLAYWVYLDARRRMMRADAWTIAVFVTNIAGFIAYQLAARARARREAVKTCTACGGKLLRAFPRCPWCGAPQEKRCPACGTEMKDDWVACPYCDGTPKPAEPEPQAPAEPPETVPFATPPQEKVQPPKQEEEPAIPLIFQDGSPFNHN